MSRDIKFKVFAVERGTIHRVNHILFDVDGTPERITARLRNANGQFNLNGKVNGGRDRAFHLMQYTGLKDKNGVEIYEGDIVKILYTDWPSQLDSHPELSHEQYLDMLAETKVVIWKVQGFYVSTRVDGYAESMEPGTHGYIEVIGNIYENQELLEAKS